MWHHNFLFLGTNVIQRCSASYKDVSGCWNLQQSSLFETSCSYQRVEKSITDSWHKQLHINTILLCNFGRKWINKLFQQHKYHKLQVLPRFCSVKTWLMALQWLSREWKWPLGWNTVWSVHYDYFANVDYIAVIAVTQAPTTSQSRNKHMKTFFLKDNKLFCTKDLHQIPCMPLNFLVFWNVSCLWNPQHF